MSNANPEMSVAGFSDLVFGPHPAGIGGVRAKHDFPNGLSVSVVQFPGSYGYEDGLYELAIMDARGINYDTPLTGDVLGYLSEDDVSVAMRQVAELPAALARGSAQS